MTLASLYSKLGAQRKRDPPAASATDLEGERSNVHVSNRYELSNSHTQRTHVTGSSFRSRFELDEELALVGKQYGGKSKHLVITDDDVDSTMSPSTRSLGAYSISRSEPIHSIADFKMIEELKVVHHLTRPIHSDVVSLKSEKSRISRRKPRRKRGDSLERDISRTILQTADAGASEAHFLVEKLSVEESNERSARFILSDLVQHGSQMNQESSNQGPLLEQRLSIHSNNDSQDDPRKEEPSLHCGRNDQPKENVTSSNDQGKNTNSIEKGRSDPPTVNTELRRRLAASAETRRNARQLQSGADYTKTVQNGHHDEEIFILHPDPSLQDISFVTTSGSGEEKKSEDIDFLTENRFDDSDDEWTTFGDSPFRSPGQVAGSQSVRSHGSLGEEKVHTNQSRAKEILPAHPSRGGSTSQRKSRSTVVMQPKSPASVFDFRSHPTNESEIRDKYGASKWNLDLPRNEKG